MERTCIQNKKCPPVGSSMILLRLLLTIVRFVSCGTPGNANKIQLTNPLKLNFFDIFGNSDAFHTVLT